MDKIFTSATLKLTGWYLLILMVISLLFSTILYGISSNELRRSLRSGGQGPLGSIFMDTELARQLREDRYYEGVSRLLGNLIVLNVATLVAGGGISYLMARRTLRPIQESMDAQSRFTSDASHELRTPLTIMQTEIEVGLRDSTATKMDYQKLLQSNLDEVDRLRELSDRLLLLASEKDIPLSNILLDQVAIDAINHVVKAAQQKHITVTNEVKPVEVSANLEALSDVMTILLDNALKYSSEKTTVTMTSNIHGKFVDLKVSDQGSGIPDKDLPYVFDRFYRADMSRSRQHVEGHGLGLSIAERIVKQHNGQLLVESKVGSGTTFTVRLPLS